MIIELTGLPGAGKTHLANALGERGAVIVQPRSRPVLLVRAALFECTHPLLALRLAATVLGRAPKGMRYSLYMNGYLVTAAKWVEARRLSKRGKIAVIDQGHAQLVVSLPGLSPSLIRALPKPDRLVLVELPRNAREARMAERGRAPRSERGDRPAEAWDREAETAFETAKPHFMETYPSVLSVNGTEEPEHAIEKLLSGARLRPVRAPFLKRALLCFARLASLFVPRHGAAVLMYHAVDDSGWRLSIPPAEFDSQMRHLKERQAVVPLADVVAYAKGEKELPSNAVAITFDDGYHDLVTNVLPVIRKYGLPITLFLTTNLDERTDPLGLPRVTEKDLGILRESGLVSIESHGRTHPHLPRLTEEMVRKEVIGAKEALKARGLTTQYFAYPFGDRSLLVESIVREAGHEAAFSITEGFVRPGDDLMRLKRIQADTTTTGWLFRARLTSALTLNRALVDWLRV